MNLATEAHRIMNIAQGLVFSSNATLTLMSYEQSAGETELLTIDTGWLPDPSRDQSTSSATVWVIERDDITTALMNTVARFTMNDTTYRVIQGGITPPVFQPRMWQIQGEEIRDNT